jgi:hypothetical protein
MLAESHPLYEAELMLLMLFQDADPEHWIEFRAIWNVEAQKKGLAPFNQKRIVVEGLQVRNLEKSFDLLLADWISQHDRVGYDVYFGVCPRLVMRRTKDGYMRAGSADVISHGVCAWMDYDKFDFAGIIRDTPKPTFVVKSGHGAHFYYKYPKAVGIEKATEDSRRIVEKFNGDKAYDAPRILRVPGTRNWKEINRELRATVVHVDFDATFEGMLAQGAVTSGPKTIADVPWETKSLIINGHEASSTDPDKSKVDFHVMEKLLEYGFSDEAIKEIFFNPEYGISAKVIMEAETKGNADNYFRRTLEAARLEKQKKALYFDEIGDVVQFETTADLDKAEPLEFAVDRILPVGGMLLVTGPSKTGKSLLVTDMALLLAGCPGLVMESFKVRRPGKVVYAQAEVSRGSLKYRLALIADSRKEIWKDLPIEFLNKSFDLASPKNVSSIANGLRKSKVDYFIVDPLARFHHMNENKQGDMAMVLKSLETIAKEGGCTGTILVHHHGKPVADGEREGVHRIRGASVIGDWGNAHVLLQKKYNKITGKKYVRAEFELRDAEEPTPINLMLNKDTLRFHEYSEDNDKLPVVREVINRAGDETDAINEIRFRLKTTKDEARRLYHSEVASKSGSSGNGNGHDDAPAIKKGQVIEIDPPHLQAEEGVDEGYSGEDDEEE